MWKLPPLNSVQNLVALIWQLDARFTNYVIVIVIQLIGKCVFDLLCVQVLSPQERIFLNTGEVSLIISYLAEYQVTQIMYYTRC